MYQYIIYMKKCKHPEMLFPGTPYMIANDRYFVKGLRYTKYTRCPLTAAGFPAILMLSTEYKDPSGRGAIPHRR